jgi:hypothetical protein
MPVTFVQPPLSIAEHTKTTLQNMAQQKSFRIAPLAKAEPAQITLTSPHAIYYLGLDSIVSNQPLSAAQFTGWRFIVQTKSSEPAAAEMQSDLQSTTATFASVNSGPFVAGTIAALQSLSADKAFAKGDWEARMLRIPALHIMAIWAHQKKTGEDLIRVSDPAPPFLTTQRSYPWPEFRATLQAPARQVLDFDSRPKP